jgi:hypothetical protein
LNPRHHEVQLEDQKPRKVQDSHLEEVKTAKPTSGTKSDKIKE